MTTQTLDRASRREAETSFTGPSELQPLVQSLQSVLKQIDDEDARERDRFMRNLPEASVKDRALAILISAPWTAGNLRAESLQPQLKHRNDRDRHQAAQCRHLCAFLRWKLRSCGVSAKEAKINSISSEMGLAEPIVKEYIRSILRKVRTRDTERMTELGRHKDIAGERIVPRGTTTGNSRQQHLHDLNRDPRHVRENAPVGPRAVAAAANRSRSSCRSASG